MLICLLPRLPGVACAGAAAAVVGAAAAWVGPHAATRVVPAARAPKERRKRRRELTATLGGESSFRRIRHGRTSHSMTDGSLLLWGRVLTGGTELPPSRIEVSEGRISRVQPA